MIIEDHLPADERETARDDEIFDLERSAARRPSRQRVAIAAGAAAMAMAAALAITVVRQIGPDDADTGSAPPASFELIDPDAAEPAAVSAEVRDLPSSPGPAVVPSAIDASPVALAPPTAVPDGAARFVASTPTRLIDTRSGEAPPPETELTIAVPSFDTVALSISIIDAERSGTVLVDGRRGIVEALRLPGAGATTTNLTIVPVADGEITVRSSAGGHLVIDAIGGFETVDEPVDAGRFVAVDRYRIGRLVTADEGRELDLPLIGRAWVDDIAYDTEGTQTAGRDYDLTGATAVVALITADVAGEGGTIRIGSAPDEYGQMLMWGPASGTDRIRHGLAILTPANGRLAALRYDGGSELTVEVVGYFTGADAASDDAGLLLPTDPQTLARTAIPAGSNRVIGGFDPDASGAIVTLNPTNGVPGRLGAGVVATADGFGSIWTRDDVEVVVTLLAEFR